MQCAVEHSLCAGVAVFLLMKEKQTGPGNIRAAVPASGCVIKLHRASLRQPGNKGKGRWMPSHPPPTTLPPTLTASSRTGAKPEPEELGRTTNTSTCSLTLYARSPLLNALLFMTCTDFCLSTFEDLKHTSHEHDSTVHMHKVRKE